MPYIALVDPKIEVSIGNGSGVHHLDGALSHRGDHLDVHHGGLLQLLWKWTSCLIRVIGITLTRNWCHGQQERAGDEVHALAVHRLRSIHKIGAGRAVLARSGCRTRSALGIYGR